MASTGGGWRHGDALRQRGGGGTIGAVGGRWDQRGRSQRKKGEGGARGRRERDVGAGRLGGREGGMKKDVFFIYQTEDIKSK
jgi:hypothetical protein